MKQNGACGWEKIPQAKGIIKSFYSQPLLVVGVARLVCDPIHDAVYDQTGGVVPDTFESCCGHIAFVYR